MLQTTMKIDKSKTAQEKITSFRDITSKRYILSRVIPKLIRPDLIKDPEEVTIPFLNMYIYFSVVLDEEGEEQISYKLNKDTIESSEITIGELKKAALGNIRNDYEVKPIQDVLGFDVTNQEPTFYVMSNNKKHFGAVNGVPPARTKTAPQSQSLPS